MAKRKAKAKPEATPDGALKAGLREAVSANQILPALAAVEWRRVHSGHDCPASMIPTVAQWSDHVCNTAGPGWQAGADAFNDSMAECVAAIGLEAWREFGAERLERMKQRRAALGVPDGEPLIEPDYHELGWVFELEQAQAIWLAAIGAKPDASIKHPLGAWMRGWQERGVEPNMRPDRIFSAPLVMFAPREGDARGRLFSPAAHVVRQGNGQQLILPGFERDMQIPALPLVLYDFGNSDSPGPGAPVPLRLTVEGCLAAPLWRRLLNEPVPVEMTLRVLLARLWPGRYVPPNEWRPALEAAAAALAKPEARIPWPGGERSAVLLSNMPTGLDDMVRLIVDLPPGSEHGPQVSPRLHEYGPRQGRHYRALLNLAFWWHEPGRTLIPARGGKHWLRVNDPRRYRKPSDAELVNLVYPTSARGEARKLVHEASRVVAELEADGELRIVAGKLLPPLAPKAKGPASGLS